MRPITVEIDGTVRRGRVVSLPPDVSPGTVLEAIRGGDTGRLTVDCEQPRPVHDHVGHIHGGMGIRTRTALARAARSRDLTTEYDAEIERLDAEIAACEAELADHESGDCTPSRRSLAEQGTGTELREAVAAARGRLRACRDHGTDTDDAVERLEAAISELAEQETSAAAARERLAQARERSRRRREIRDRRLRLEDRRANLEREARATLVDRLRDEFAAAVDAVPGTPTPAEPFDAADLPAALAVGHVAALAAPVVLDCELFDSPQTASEWLGAPIVNV